MGYVQWLLCACLCISVGENVEGTVPRVNSEYHMSSLRLVDNEFAHDFAAVGSAGCPSGKGCYSTQIAGGFIASPATVSGLR